MSYSNCIFTSARIISKVRRTKLMGTVTVDTAVCSCGYFTGITYLSHMSGFILVAMLGL